jgi:hypothetical protein
MYTLQGTNILAMLLLLLLLVLLLVHEQDIPEHQVGARQGLM